MKTYYLNIVLDGNDSIVTYYDTLKALRNQWADDARDFLSEHGIKADENTNWYGYFTKENADGTIIELSPREALGSAA